MSEIALEMTASLETVRAVLQRSRFLVDDEKRLQASIADALNNARIPFEREVRLAPTDVIDFLAEDIGIEVKVKGGKRAILRQIERYAQSDRIESLILVSSIAIGLPETIGGKPLCIVSIGRSWL